MNAILKIIKFRKQILEGVANTIIKKDFVETVAAHRQTICDTCDEYGGECLVPGTGPCCGACGCSLQFKLRSMSSPCGLISLGKEPKWLPVLSQAHEDEHLNEIEDGNTTK